MTIAVTAFAAEKMLKGVVGVARTASARRADPWARCRAACPMARSRITLPVAADAELDRRVGAARVERSTARQMRADARRVDAGVTRGDLGADPGDGAEVRRHAAAREERDGDAGEELEGVHGGRIGTSGPVLDR